MHLDICNVLFLVKHKKKSTLEFVAYCITTMVYGDDKDWIDNLPDEIIQYIEFISNKRYC